MYLQNFLKYSRLSNNLVFNQFKVTQKPFETVAGQGGGPG